MAKGTETGFYTDKTKVLKGTTHDTDLEDLTAKP